MSTQKDQNFVTKTRNEFVLSAENAIKEIHDKFANFHSQLNRGEIDLRNNVEKIQADILQKFDEITPKLKEIQQCRDAVIAILTNNTNKQLLETQLSSFTAEIDGVIGQSEIDKLIRLKWKYCELPINDVCTIATINHERPGAYTHPQPGQDTRFSPNLNPGQDTRFPGNRFPPNTPNKPQDFRMDPSRDVDELQSANTQQQYQPYEYGETVNPQRNSNPQDPTRQFPAPNMQDYSHGAGNVVYHVNIPTNQGYPLQELAYPVYPAYSAYLGAYQDQTEDMQNFAQAIGNMQLTNPVRRQQSPY